MLGEGVQFGEFVLLRRLGAGGMAEVFLARRDGPEGFEKQLVVKRLLPHLARSERFTQMLLREARYAALIDHPNFVHVSGFGVIDDGYYLAMEYVDGLTIKDLLAVVDSLSPGVAARIAIDLLDALHAIHTAKYLDGGELHLVHRDITPGNVMITASGTVKVLDLGIAVPSNEVAPVRAGTRRYMSPEQSRGETLDARSDLFCVGLLLCLMLSGRHPFVVDDLTSTLAQAPPVLRDIIMGLMQEDREERPSSAREVQEWLEEFAVTRGREGTRAFLSELAAEVADARPVPKPRTEATASCLLSFAVPDFDGTEAPTRSEFLILGGGSAIDASAPRGGPEEATAIGLPPEPPLAHAEETGKTPLARDTVEEARPPELDDVFDTLELNEQAAKDALQADVWPLPLFDMDVVGPDPAAAEDAQLGDDSPRPITLMDFTGPDDEASNDALPGYDWPLAISAGDILGHEEDDEIPARTIVPTIVEELEEMPNDGMQADPIEPAGPSRAAPTRHLPWLNAVDPPALEDPPKARLPRIARGLSVVAAAFVLVAVWGLWRTSHSTEAASHQSGTRRSSAANADRVPTPLVDLDVVHADEGAGYLELDVQPWADVSVDGLAIGRTPLRKLALEAGQRRVRLRNPKAGLDTTFAVEVTAGETTRVQRRFGPQE